MDDWDQVTIIRKKAPQGKSLKSEEALRQGLRSGAGIISERKTAINSNLKGVEGSKQAKIDRENDVVAIEKVDRSLSQTIQKTRLELKLSQKDLATKINEKPIIVGEYESGKSVPNQQILQKMERVLGVKLRGKDIGMPLFNKK